jgi:hypothetical protein
MLRRDLFKEEKSIDMRIVGDGGLGEWKKGN